jgi:hypothetical protein
VGWRTGGSCQSSASYEQRADRRNAGSVRLNALTSQKQQEDPGLKLEYSDLATMWPLTAQASEETGSFRTRQMRRGRRTGALFVFVLPNAITLCGVRLATIAPHEPVGAVAYGKDRKPGANERARHAMSQTGARRRRRRGRGRWRRIAGPRSERDCWECYRSKDYGSDCDLS